jgi:hypothetical protein
MSRCPRLAQGSHRSFEDSSARWWFITLLTIGYMVVRGLAKAGSREPYDDRR